MNENTIREYLLNHREIERASFHMPGHKGMDFFERMGKTEMLSNLYDYDITEIEGADNLFRPEGIIRNLMNRYRDYYSAVESHLLVNGSSAGIIAAILATLKRGDRFLLGRTAHKSAVNGLYLAGGKPEYIYPEFLSDFGVSGAITTEEVKRGLDLVSDAKAVLITSPSYCGVTSDVEAISKLVHSRGKVLIVDQAHGAHLKMFHDTGRCKVKDAERSGADIVINSIHKTLGSCTQSAIMNICSGNVSRAKIGDALQMVETSSPSYPMMLSLETNMDILDENETELAKNWLDDLEYFRREATSIKGLKMLEHPRLDPSKLNLDLSSVGLSGRELAESLMKRGIYTELDRGSFVLAMTGIGQKREDYDLLLESLESISREGIKGTSINITSKKRIFSEDERISDDWERVHIGESVGRICAENIVPYPPGIPLVVKGETLDEETVKKVLKLKNERTDFMGMDESGYIWCLFEKAKQV